jgi:hypothetical protein
MSMHHIDERSNSPSGQPGQLDDELSQHNPSPTAEIIRRGKEAMERQRRGLDDWMDIAEALQVGRIESMRAAQTNEPKGKRYEKIMGEWLVAHSFHIIDKGTRTRLLECLQHRAAIEKWRAILTEGERFRLNHPDTVLRKWKAATVIPDPNSPPKTSAFAELKAANVELQEKLYRAERELSLGGGDLWTPEDAPEDIATVMLVKLSPSKAERVARAILKKVKDKRAPPVPRRELSAEEATL